MDGAIVVRNDVPTRLRSPSGAVNFLVKQVQVRHGLRRPDDLLLLLGQISREAHDSFWAHPDTPVSDFDVRENVGAGELVLLTLRRFVSIRGEGGDIDQPGNAVIGSRGCDNCSAV